MSSALLLNLKSNQTAQQIHPEVPQRQYGIGATKDGQCLFQFSLCELIQISPYEFNTKLEQQDKVMLRQIQ